MSGDILDLLGPDTPPPAPPAPGACHVCRADPARDCTSCGRPACPQHLWTMLGVCTDCTPSDRMERFHRSARADDRNWLEEP